MARGARRGSVPVAGRLVRVRHLRAGHERKRRRALPPQNLDELLVVVVIVSMALTPLAVDAAMAIAGPTLDLSPCESDPQDPDGSSDVAWEMAESYGQDLPEGESPILGSEVEAAVEAKIIDSD